MSDTPTPRTDAEDTSISLEQKGLVRADFARQLERELSAANADLLEVQQVIGSYHFDIEHPAAVIKAIIEGNQKTTEELAAVSEERDELVGAFNKAGQALGPCTDWIATPRDEVLANGISEMRAERDRLREECEEAKRQRDEWQDRSNAFEQRHKDMEDCFGRLSNSSRESEGKLREECERLKAQLEERTREVIGEEFMHYDDLMRDELARLKAENERLFAACSEAEAVLRTSKIDPELALAAWRHVSSITDALRAARNL